MKHNRRFLLLIMLLALLVAMGLGACSKQDKTENTVETGLYVMQDVEGSAPAPALQIDAQEQSFVFCYDALSSYLPLGTWTLEGGVLTATTDDGERTYRFALADDGSLRLMLDGEVALPRVAESAPSVGDGALFVREAPSE